jgi:hypothetical protein
MNSSGLITRWVVPSRYGVLSFSSTCPAALSCTRSFDSAGQVIGVAQLFKPLAAVHLHWQRGVQTEAVDVSTQVTDDNFNIFDTPRLAETLSSTMGVLTSLQGAVAAASLLV